MKRPANPNTKAFRKYQDWLLMRLAQEISSRASNVLDEEWLRESVQFVEKIDPDITDDMVQEAMRLAIAENKQHILWHQVWFAETRIANERMEHACSKPRRIEVVASPEIAALFSKGPLVPSEVLLRFKPRRTEE